jgi:hypothetical protein
MYTKQDVIQIVLLKLKKIKERQSGCIGYYNI